MISNSRGLTQDFTFAAVRHAYSRFHTPYLAEVFLAEAAHTGGLGVSSIRTLLIGHIAESPTLK